MTKTTIRLLATAAAVVVLGACGSSTTTSEGTSEGTSEEPSPVASDGTPGTIGSTAVTTDAVPTSTADSTPDTTVAPGSTVAPATTASPETTSAPQTTVTVAPTTVAPPPPPPTPTSATAVVYGGGGGEIPWAPLAWWDGAAWNGAGYSDDGSFVDPPPASIAAVAATSLDLPDGQGQVIQGLTLGAEDFYCVGDEMGPRIDGVDVADTPVSLGYDVLAVTADWPLQPRPVAQVGADNPEYATVGASLVDAPTADLGTVSQAVRADLDGDGIEEVLVTYQYLTENQFGAENDFSIVYARFAEADGSVRNQVLEEYVLDSPDEFPTVGRYTIAAVADLNGDGVMEIATRYSFWEAAGISAWTLDGDSLVRIGSAGCGV